MAEADSLGLAGGFRRQFNPRGFLISAEKFTHLAGKGLEEVLGLQVRQGLVTVPAAHVNPADAIGGNVDPVAEFAMQRWVIINGRDKVFDRRQPGRLVTVVIVLNKNTVHLNDPSRFATMNDLKIGREELLMKFMIDISTYRSYEFCMDLNLYAVCAAIMRHGSVSQAAQSLGLTQPATSNALTRLRRQLGDQLFVRSKNGMLPTKFATDMAPIIDRALGDLQNVTQDHAVSDIVQADLKGNFTFVMSDLEVVLFIIDLVGGLSPAAPGVSIEVRPFRSDILQESLELARVDFVSARMATPMKNLVSRRLLELDFVCVMGSRNGLGCEEVTVLINI